MTKFVPRRLDVKSFAEDAGVLEGADPIRDFPRLAAETQGRGTETPVQWSASAEVRNPRHLRPQVWLHLRAATTLSLICQRCLNPVETPVAVDRLFRFVEDEATAAAEDDESEEDVLALGRQFDLMQLIEDELLMDLPLAPHHATCPPVNVHVADEAFEGTSARRENPFAALEGLRKRPDGSDE